MKKSLVNLNIIRLFAILLVTVQHVFSVLGQVDAVYFGNTSVGQYGVTLFCTISGFLALQDSRAAFEWFKRRLARIYPPYWIAMAFSFLAAGVFSYEPFGLFQVVSQMLGLGFFTHGWYLINDASWFVSLILVCYVLAFAAKILGRPALASFCFAGVFTVVLGLHIEVALARHLIPFLLAAVAGNMNSRSQILFLLGCIIPAQVLSFVDLQFSYSLFGLAILLLGLNLPDISFPGVYIVSSYVYEYFLVHGPCFVSAGKVFPKSPLAIVLVGFILSFSCAWFLHRISTFSVWCRISSANT